MKAFLGKLRWFVDHSMVNLIILLVLLSTNLAEVGETLVDDLLGLNFKGGHGVVVFALFAAIKQLSLLFQTVEESKTGSD